jgi:hypothetical protein
LPEIPTKFVTRKSDYYKPVNPKKIQNYSWPTKPNYDDPFVSVESKD